MLDLSQRIETSAVKFLRGLGREAVKVNSVHVDEHGQSHVRGGIFNAKGGRDVALSMAGLSAKDVANFRRELKDSTGITLSQEQADGLLMEARSLLGNGMLGTMTEDARAYEREKKAKRRQWARENGLCIKCCKNPTSDRADGVPAVTCRDCQRKANEAKRKKAL